MTSKQSEIVYYIISMYFLQIKSSILILFVFNDVESFIRMTLYRVLQFISEGPEQGNKMNAVHINYKKFESHHSFWLY